MYALAYRFCFVIVSVVSVTDGGIVIDIISVRVSGIVSVVVSDIALFAVSLSVLVALERSRYVSYLLL